MATSPKSTRAENAYRLLKAEIRVNALPPGYQATEPELALRLSVSRTTIREALVRLEAEGLVELIPRRGARVLPLRAEDMREIYEILLALEPDAAARLAARKPSAADLAPMEQAADCMEAALLADDLDAWAAADDQFHLSLLDLHGNRRTRAFVGALNDQVHRARMITLRLREPPVKSNEEHRQILAGLGAGRPDLARRAFTQHRERAANELTSLLNRLRIHQI